MPAITRDTKYHPLLAAFELQNKLTFDFFGNDEYGRCIPDGLAFVKGTDEGILNPELEERWTQFIEGYEDFGDFALRHNEFEADQP